MEGDTVVKGSLYNEEVNSNYSRKEMNSRRFANSVPQKTAEISGAEHSCTGKTRAGRFTSLLLGTWFFFQCLICYAVLFALVIPLFPVIAVFFILKTVEQVLVKTTNGGIALNASDALWQQSSDVNRLAINGLICVENTHSFDEGMKSFRRAILERMVDAKKDPFYIPSLEPYIPFTTVNSLSFMNKSLNQEVFALFTKMRTLKLKSRLHN